MALYADDSKLYHVSSSVEDCLALASDMLSVQEWLRTWQLQVNTSKCEILSIGSGNMFFPHRVGYIVPHAHSCRDLGVFMSSDLSSTNHCAILANRCHYKCRQFRRAFACKDRKFLVVLYCTYIRPVLESSSPVWSPYLVSDINRIENVQRKFTKYIPGLFGHSYRDRLQLLDLDTLEIRRIRADLILMYKIVHGLMDIDITKFFTYNTSCTRGHPLKIDIQHARINCRKYFYINRTTPIWNSLSTEIVQTSSLRNFKKLLLNVDLSIYCRGCAHST